MSTHVKTKKFNPKAWLVDEIMPGSFHEWGGQIPENPFLITEEALENLGIRLKPSDEILFSFDFCTGNFVGQVISSSRPTNPLLLLCGV